MAECHGMGDFARLSEQDRAHNLEITRDKRRAASNVAKVTQLLESISNHGSISYAKHMGKTVNLQAHVVVFSNTPPNDYIAKMPKRILAFQVDAKEYPPAEKDCVVTPLEDPDTKNVEWNSPE